jgi:hypothetical protein
MTIPETLQALFGTDFLGLCGQDSWRECLLGDAGLIGFSVHIANVCLIIWILTIEGRRFAHERAETGYGDLDDLYQSILQQRLARPWLVDMKLFAPSDGLTLEQATEARRTHAYMVWTMLETIHDRLGTGSGKKDVRCVWQPVIRREGALFLPELLEFWQNERAFRDKFITFLRNGGFCRIYGKSSEDEAAT